MIMAENMQTNGAVDVLAVMDAAETRCGPELAAAMTEARAGVAELIAERDRLANIVSSHEAQIERMKSGQVELIRAAGSVAVDLSALGAPTKTERDDMIACLRAAIARVGGGK
jgi:hypothetical protein